MGGASANVTSIGASSSSQSGSQSPLPATIQICNSSEAIIANHRRRSVKTRSKGGMRELLHFQVSQHLFKFAAIFIRHDDFGG